MFTGKRESMATVKQIKVYKPSADEIKLAKTWPVWNCGQSTFDWEYTQQETCYILEGEVIIKDPSGSEQVSFGPGDMVIFPTDLSCQWQVTKAVKKHYKFD